MRLLCELFAAAGSADTPRAMARALSRPIAARVPLARLELSSGDRTTLCEWHDGAPATGSRAVALLPGLTIWPRGPLPAAFQDSSFRAALGEVVRSALRHLTVVRKVAELSRRAHAANRALRAEVDRLAPPAKVVALSPAMRAVMARVELVARHPTTVLLTGESGTGKEVIAREIHQRSPRAHRPFLQINCGAIPAPLVESELFGHEPGSFTGADRRHAGVFERAHRGSLLLDEVGELPPAAQVKLLRVLQERQVRRVGGTELLEVDVRLLAATNRPLAAMVEDGAFRQDLYYRLHVFAIDLPPLRQRRADLAPLVAQLVAELAARLRVQAPPISRALLRRLAAHDWPGNVRELANVLEAALILGGGRDLDVPADLLYPSARPGGGHSLEATVRAAIETALRSSRGAIYGSRGAAQQLGLKPATLQSKMKRLGIRRQDFV